MTNFRYWCTQCWRLEATDFLCELGGGAGGGGGGWDVHRFFGILLGFGAVGFVDTDTYGGTQKDNRGTLMQGSGHVKLGFSQHRSPWHTLTQKTINLLTTN